MTQLSFPKNQWRFVLKTLLKSNETASLFEKVNRLYQTQEVSPEINQVFHALELTSYTDTKVVILGQDPYPTPGNAMGLSFSVNPGVKIPASLQNIFKERYDDLGIMPSDNGDLTNWASQGVLLLNTILTVENGKPHSHANIGWETFTQQIIRVLGQRRDPIVFILWGRYAQNFEPLIAPHHLVIKTPHPSPLSAYRGFFGSKPFSKTNQFLNQIGERPIDWRN